MSNGTQFLDTTKSNTEFRLDYVQDGVCYERVCRECLDCDTDPTSYEDCQCFHKLTGEEVPCPVFTQAVRYQVTVNDDFTNPNQYRVDRIIIGTQEYLNPNPTTDWILNTNASTQIPIAIPTILSIQAIFVAGEVKLEIVANANCIGDIEIYTSPLDNTGPSVYTHLFTPDTIVEDFPNGSLRLKSCACLKKDFIPFEVMCLNKLENSFDSGAQATTIAVTNINSASLGGGLFNITIDGDAPGLLALETFYNSLIFTPGTYLYFSNGLTLLVDNIVSFINFGTQIFIDYQATSSKIPVIKNTNLQLEINGYSGYTNPTWGYAAKALLTYSNCLVQETKIGTVDLESISSTFRNVTTNEIIPIDTDWDYVTKDCVEEPEPTQTFVPHVAGCIKRNNGTPESCTASFLNPIWVGRVVGITRVSSASTTHSMEFETTPGAYASVLTEIQGMTVPNTRTQLFTQSFGSYNTHDGAITSVVGNGTDTISFNFVLGNNTATTPSPSCTYSNHPSNDYTADNISLINYLSANYPIGVQQTTASLIFNGIIAETIVYTPAVNDYEYIPAKQIVTELDGNYTEFYRTPGNINLPIAFNSTTDVFSTDCKEEVITPMPLNSICANVDDIPTYIIPIARYQDGELITPIYSDKMGNIINGVVTEAQPCDCDCLNCSVEACILMDGFDVFDIGTITPGDFQEMQIIENGVTGATVVHDYTTTNDGVNKSSWYTPWISALNALSSWTVTIETDTLVTSGSKVNYRFEYSGPGNETLRMYKGFPGQSPATNDYMEISVDANGIITTETGNGSTTDLWSTYPFTPCP